MQLFLVFIYLLYHKQQATRTKLYHGVTLEQAKRYVLYSAAAYCNIKNMKYWQCKNCINQTNQTLIIKTIYNSKFNTFVYLSINYYNKEIVVGFRGTYDKLNNNMDLKLYKSDLFENNNNGVMVHTGFLLMANSLYSELETEIREVKSKYPHYMLVFTGHSMGGALALLSTVMLKRNRIISNINVKTVTYGQPRVGNIEFVGLVESMGLNVIRVINNKDLIPLLPPKFIGYKHVGLEIFINNNITKECWRGSTNCSNNMGFLKSLSAHFAYWGIKVLTTC